GGVLDPRGNGDLDPLAVPVLAQLDGSGGAAKRLFQGNLCLTLDVLAAQRRPAPGAGPRGSGTEPACAATAEERLEEVAERSRVTEQVLELVGRDGAVLELRPGLERVGTWAAGALPLLVFLPARTEFVVLLSLVGITQDLVGLVDLLEPLLRLLVALVDVGVMLARQLAKGAVNLLGGGRSGHTQRRVVVLEGRGHLSRTYRGQSRAKRFAPSARWYSGRARGPDCRTAWRRGAIPDHVKHSAPHPMRKLSHIGSAALLALAAATAGIATLPGEVTATAAGFSALHPLPGLKAGR